MIPRLLETQIRGKLFQNKAIVVLGPRQTGKTTLLQILAQKSNHPFLWLNGDEADVRQLFTNATSTKLLTFIGNKKCVFIDEAQRIKDIGIGIKLIVDNVSGIQVIASGSSSFELSSHLNEPLTGRKYEYKLYPLSIGELHGHFGEMEESRLLQHRLMFGLYPEVVTRPGEEREVLSLLTGSYLYKDILVLENVKKTDALERLIQALAFQIGNQVSYNELGQTTGLDNETIERYIDLLEKAFVIFRLPAFSRNLRNEIKKTRKVYFYDNGIRNAVIKNFNPPGLRNDIGQLWENFLVSERRKRNAYNGLWCNTYFWRTYSKQEIDYIEEYEGKLHSFEFKWNVKKTKTHFSSFKQAYPESETKIIHPDNYREFVV